MNLLSWLILTAVLAFAQASPEVQLKAAMHKEQVEGDLKNAIECVFRAMPISVPN